MKKSLPFFGYCYIHLSVCYALPGASLPTVRRITARQLSKTNPEALNPHWKNSRASRKSKEKAVSKNKKLYKEYRTAKKAHKDDEENT